MKLSLQPQTDFPIVRQLADHTDVTTYYVRAVIRNPVTDVTLDTVNLTNLTGGRFKKLYRLPADISGQGTFIDITTSVYTDSGYTTKASTYGDENETYLVIDSISKNGGGGSGGSDIDYKKFQKMLDKVVTDLTDSKGKDVSPIMEALNNIQKEISNIELDVDFPPQEKINLEPLQKAIDATGSKIIKAIANKDVTPETDLTPVLEAIAGKETDLSGIDGKLDILTEKLDEHVEDFNDKYEEGAEAKEKLNQMSSIFSGVTPVQIPKKGKELKKEVEDDENSLPNRVKNLL